MIEIADDGVATVHDAAAERHANRSNVSAVSFDDAARAAAFDAAARRHNIDAALLRAVAWTESRGRNEAVSPKGAIGIMQLMPATAASLGVDPRDPLANIDGGAAYLSRQLTTFRSVPLALAAYNAGPGAVMRHRGVPPYAETRAYVDGIMRRLGLTSGTGTGSTQIPAVLPPVPRRTAQLAVESPVLLIEVASP